VQQEIQNAAYEYQRAVETQEATVVGVNRFTQENDSAVPIQRIDESLERKQVEGVRVLRAKRNQESWERALQSVRSAARTRENLMPKILEAVEACATVGEISDAMRWVFGEYQETVVI
jgi:methylmalonyl-CoA mutase N-terminal domain/subunit